MITFYIVGEPVPAPRPRARAMCVDKIKNKWIAQIYAPDEARHGNFGPWKQQMIAVARRHIPVIPIDGPVSLTCSFYLPRAASHFRGANPKSNVIRPTAPRFPMHRSDVDNLIKGVMDTLTELQFWRDDSQVIEEHVSKRFADPIMPMGCGVTVRLAVDSPVDLYERQISETLKEKSTGPPSPALMARDVADLA